VHLSRKRQDGFAPKFFAGVKENTCSLQLALKSNALGSLWLKIWSYIKQMCCIKFSRSKTIAKLVAFILP